MEESVKVDVTAGRAVSEGSVLRISRRGRKLINVKQLWAVPGAAVFPHLAGHQSALQADGAGRGLGDHPAVADDGGVQPVLRPAREGASDGIPYPLFAMRRWCPGRSLPTG